MRVVPAIHLIVLCASWASADAAAATKDRVLPDTITLEEALKLLNEISPRALVDHAQVGLAAADLVGAETWPNPTMSYAGIGLVRGSNTGAAGQHQILLEQPLLLFGQAGSRKASVDRRIDAERARVRSVLADRTLALSLAFADLLASQERVSVLEDGVKDLERVAAIMRGRASAGDRSQYDRVKINLEASRALAELELARVEVRSSSRQVAKLIGGPDWAPRAEGTLAPRHVPSDLDQLWSMARGRHPAIVAAQAGIVAAQEEVQRAKRDALPIPSLGLGAQFTHDVASASVVVTLSVPLPIFDRNQVAISRGRASVELAARELDAELSERRADVERAWRACLLHQSVLAEMENEQVGQIPVLRQMAELAYQVGDGSILELLDTLRSIKDVRLSYLDERAALRRADEMLRSSIGRNPESAIESYVTGNSNAGDARSRARPGS